MKRLSHPTASPGHHPQARRIPRGQMQALQQLAGLYGVQTAYVDVSQRRRQASVETLLTVLQLLGAPIATVADAPAALRQRRQTLWQRGVEPVIALWDGKPAQLALRLPSTRAAGTLSGCLELETGEVHRWEAEIVRLPTVRTVEVEGVPHLVQRLTVPLTLPCGYHRLSLETAAWHGDTLLIVAPRRAYVPPESVEHRDWGVFSPLYALHSERSWGGGDFSDLEMLLTWIAELGGGVLATLPLLAAFLDDPYDPSPYTPASRLFWNEFYIDVTRAPGLQRCSAALGLLASDAIQQEITTLRQASLVDYRRQMALKRRILTELSQHLFADASEPYTALQRFVETHPVLEDYARFRAVGERQQAPWPAWPEPLRSGTLCQEDYDEQARRYHLYVQWVAHEQLTSMARRSWDTGVKLYLDLPLGVHPYSYDVWRERDVFVSDAAGGAPPDVVFTKGQNWGFPPLHPEAMRAQGYRYWLAYLRHQLKHTGLLRIDHVMGLHRLFWVPKGLEPRQGVYVRYPAEELYAMLNLESHRHQVIIVGENLGTVPAYVNTAMARHRLHRMYVVQYELAPRPDGVLPVVPADTVASLNTHDMPPFAAYVQGLDIDDRQQQGLMKAADARRERRHRQALLVALQRFLQSQNLLAPNADMQALCSACVAVLGASPAQVVLLNLEDLWLETQPQNFPGTSGERPNWQRKARYNLEAFCHMPQVLALLRSMNHLRKRG
jgi:4-alpha-glucanotransferase